MDYEKLQLHRKWIVVMVKNFLFLRITETVVVMVLILL